MTKKELEAIVESLSAKLATLTGTATPANPIAISEIKPAKAKKPCNEMLGGFEGEKHPEYDGYSRLFFTDAKGKRFHAGALNPLDTTALDAIARLKSVSEGNARLRCIFVKGAEGTGAGRAWSGRNSLFVAAGFGKFIK